MLSDEYLKALSEKLISENKTVISFRDFNIDLLKCDSNKIVSDCLDMIYFTNFLLNITSPTRQSQTLIDNIFSSVINDDIYKRNFKQFCSKEFITDSEIVNWDNILDVFEDNVNKFFQNVSNKITDILEKHVPITKLSLKVMKSSNKPWITKESIKEILFIGNFLELKIFILKKFTT